MYKMIMVSVLIVSIIVLSFERISCSVYDTILSCVLFFQLKNDPTVKRVDLEEGHVIIYLDGVGT